MKEYMGDGVYAEYDEYGDILLTTEDGLTTSNTIVLDRGVWKNLELYVKNMNEQEI